jgi:hypothetical protein
MYLLENAMGKMDDIADVLRDIRREYGKTLFFGLALKSDIEQPYPGEI